MPEILTEAPTEEPQLRNSKNFVRKAGRFILTPLVIGGLWLGGHASQGENNKVELSTISDSGHQPANPLSVSEEHQLQQAAAQKAADIKKWNEAVWNQAVWNNAVWWNELNKPKIPYDPAVWERLHQCEQSDTWYANGHNSADPGHQTFQGGLGMSTRAWDIGVEAAAERGVILPGSALDATIDQQMQGAQAFYDATNGGGWACPVG